MRALLISIVILASCEQKKDYVYLETYMKTDRAGTTPQEARPVTISAVSDSAAYLQAYVHFSLAKRFYNEEFQKSGTLSGKPISFRILNENSEDITNKISVMNKDSLERRLQKRVDNYKPGKEE